MSSTRLKRCIHLILLYALTTDTTYALRPFIIDTDVGVDDAIAMLYLLQHPEIQIKAITITGDGNAHCKPALRNTLGLLRMMNQPSIPVACGQEKPLMGNHHFPTNVLNESDTLAGADLLLPPPYPKRNNRHTAVDLMIKTLQNSSEPVTILAIGPLTNIAQALQKEPQIKNHIRTIYIMGGAIHAAGNIPAVVPTSKNISAEWNIYIDPLAAQIVLNKKIPIVLIPLDITAQLPIDMKFYNTIKKNHQSPAATFVFTLLKNNISMIREHGWYFWDPLAAVISSDESIARFQTQRIKVLLEPEIRSGSTIIDRNNGFNVRVVTYVNKKQFKIILLKYLNKTN